MEHASIGRGATSTGAGRSGIAGRLLRALIGLGVLGAGGGCTELADARETAEGRLAPGPDAAGSLTPAEAGTLSPSSDPRWTCVLGATNVPVPATPPKKVRYRVILVDFFQMPLPSLPKVIACIDADRDCDSPVESSTIPFPKAPSFQIELPFNFAGFLRITSPGFITTDYSFGGPLVGSPDGKADPDGVPVVEGAALGIPSLTQLDGFYSGIVGGAVRDPARGVLAARIIDCNGKRAAGANMVVDRPVDGAVAYTLSTVPLFSTPPTGPQNTLQRGTVGYVNLKPGNYTISAVLPDKVAMARANSSELTTMYGTRAVQIKAGTLAVAEIRTDETPTAEGYTYAR